MKNFIKLSLCKRVINQTMKPENLRPDSQTYYFPTICSCTVPYSNRKEWKKSLSLSLTAYSSQLIKIKWILSCLSLGELEGVSWINTWLTDMYLPWANKGECFPSSSSRLLLWPSGNYSCTYLTFYFLYLMKGTIYIADFKVHH